MKFPILPLVALVCWYQIFRFFYRVARISKNYLKPLVPLRSVNPSLDVTNEP
jgi:hypothetical protein